MSAKSEEAAGGLFYFTCALCTDILNRAPLKAGERERERILEHKKIAQERKRKAAIVI